MLLKFAVKDFKDDREYKNLSSKMIIAYLLTLEGKEIITSCSPPQEERAILVIPNSGATISYTTDNSLIPSVQ